MPTLVLISAPTSSFAAFLPVFQCFWATLSHETPDALWSTAMFSRRFFIYFSTSSYPGLWPIWINPGDPSGTCKLQFSTILGPFLPRAPRCASLRCVFFFQIFSIFYFTTLARILDTLDQTRLDFCPVQDAVFYSGTPSAAHLVHCPDLQNLSFFT